MGGTPLPPFTDKIFGKKGVTDLGGTPVSPFTDKIRKVVFDHFPKMRALFGTVEKQCLGSCRLPKTCQAFAGGQ